MLHSVWGVSALDPQSCPPLLKKWYNLVVKSKKPGARPPASEPYLCSSKEVGANFGKLLNHILLLELHM